MFVRWNARHLSTGLVASWIGFAAPLAALAALLAACERPFVEPERPEIEIVSPDLTTIFPNTKLQLEVRVDGPRGIERVEVNGDTLTYDPEQQLWLFDFALRFGLNRLVFAAIDVDDRTTMDTVYAMHGTFSVDRNTPLLPEPRGGHTATLLDDGRLIILGGTRTVTADALDSGLKWFPPEGDIEPLGSSLFAARTGHTASLLPDGRILILGGAIREPTETVQDLVETAEIFDPETETFRQITVDGDPIRRAFHTASVHRDGDQVFVDIYGGLGDTQYRPSPSFGVRRDLRRFVLQDGALMALSPAPGPSLDYALWGHTQTRPFLFDQSANRRFVVTGMSTAGADPEAVGFLIAYGSAAGILQQSLPPPNRPRTRHAAAFVGNGFVGFFAGHAGAASSPINDVEVFSDEAERYFIFPESNVLLRRYGLSATNLPDGRILLVGGYFSAGQASVATSIVRLPFL